jgi:hypothetical protein
VTARLAAIVVVEKEEQEAQRQCPGAQLAQARQREIVRSPKDPMVNVVQKRLGEEAHHRRKDWEQWADSEQHHRTYY